MNPRLTALKHLLAGGSLPPGPVTFPPPLNKLLGIELTAIEPAEATMTMRTDPSQHANPMGTIHGGVPGQSQSRRAEPSTGFHP